MSKILVVGDGRVEKVVVEFLKSKYGDDVIQGEPLTAGQMPRVAKDVVITSKNEWRGGSRGKGGKTKWPRR